MPVGACWCVVGQVKNREAICGSFPCTGGSAIGLSATDAWRGAVSVMLQIGPTRRCAEWPIPVLRFELLDECSEMRGDGGRQGVVLVFEALPNC
jgi:hypothetical protein